MRTAAALLGMALGVWAQTPPPPELTPEQLLLARIRAHMLDTLARQPDYTCLETVERSHRDRATRKFELEDTLRLEVAVVDGKEMFAWPGSKHFEDTDLRDLVPTGTFGNGDFALHARSVFGSNIPMFEYRGETALEDRRAVRFDYDVPRILSGYQLRKGDLKEIVGFHGSFYADPQSLDVLRLEVVAEDIPANLDVAEAADTMNYVRLRIGAGDFLLPESSELMMIDASGQESRNRIRFTNCRQFTGESVLRFDDVDAGAPAPAPKREIELPVHQSITLRLSGPVDLDMAAIGDPVKAELAGDIKVKGQVLMPKGATATGRITRLDRLGNVTFMGIIFTELESDSAHAQLSLEFEGMAGLGPPAPGHVSGGRGGPHEGVLPMPAGHVRVPRGILTYWRT